VTAAQFRRACAGHTETPSGLTAAFERGRKLASTGVGTYDLKSARKRCRSAAAAEQFESGFRSVWKLEK